MRSAANSGVTNASVGKALSAVLAANVPPLSCSPSTVPFGTPVTCSAAGSPGESFTFSSSNSLGHISASSCTIAAPANNCSVLYLAPDAENDQISYAGNGFSSGASTSVTTVAEPPTDILACSQSTVVLSQSDSCSVGLTVFPDTVTFSSKNGTGTFTPASCQISSTATCPFSFMPSVGGAGQEIDGAFDDGGSVATVLNVVRAVSTTVSCAPTSVLANVSTTCTATVTDPTGVAPTGTVSFVSSGAGAFSGPRCSLPAPARLSASCSVSYTPAAVGSGKHVISATYNGDTTHAVDTGASTQITVSARSTSTTVTCTPGSVAVGQSGTCLATVSDTAGAGASAPGGTVSFVSSGPSGFDPATCMLSGTGATASCVVSYTPHKGGAGTQAVTAAYGGDALHAGTSGSANVTVTHPEGLSTATSVSCSPAIVVPGNSASCVATVRDAGGGGAMTPTGSVTFSTVGGGTVNPSGACTLTGSGGSASCRATYRPGAGAADTQTITAVYGGDLVHEGGSGFTNVARPPQTGVTAVVSVVRGQVLISLPGGGRAVAAAVGPPPAASFVPLKGVTRSVPIGSTLDTRKGVVRLVTAADDRGPLNPHHQTQSGTFAAAEFTIKQMTTAERLAAAKRQHRRRLTGIPATNLLLTNPFSAFTQARCGRTRHPGHGVIRELSAVAKGLYRTVGAASTTVVHNATWIVKDRCDGTFTEVGRGSTLVQYKVNGRQRSQVVKPGQSFFVRRPFLPPIRKGR
jgi:hypothetical protein